MRVLVWNGPWDLTVGSREDPEPGPGEVLITVAATGICGSDVHGIDAVGSTASVEAAAASSGFGARIVLVGMGSPRIDLPAYSVSTEERTLVGSFCYSARDFRETAEWVGGAPDVLARLVDGRVDMAGAPEAFRELASGAGTSKVLVYPHGVPAVP